MARQVDYEALIAKLEATDVYVAIHEDEPVLLAVCMDCDATILRAMGAEVNAAELHGAILDHACGKPADVVVVDNVAALTEALDSIEIVSVGEHLVPLSEDGKASLYVTPAPMPDRILSLSDRCDRCPAQAFVRVEAVAGPLLFCGHHYAKAALTITAAGYVVIDERAHINSRPGASAPAE